MKKKIFGTMAILVILFLSIVPSLAVAQEAGEISVTGTIEIEHKSLSGTYDVDFELFLPIYMYCGTITQGDEQHPVLAGQDGRYFRMTVYFDDHIETFTALTRHYGNSIRGRFVERSWFWYRTVGTLNLVIEE